MEGLDAEEGGVGVVAEVLCMRFPASNSGNDEKRRC